MKVLVDTSVWSSSLRRAKGAHSAVSRELHALILDRRVQIIGPIRQELLSGIREQAQFDRLRKHLAPFPNIPLDDEDFVEAARFFNRCRSKGIQGSNTDFLICAVAARRGLAIYTTDRDFTRFAKYLPIVLHRAGGLRHDKV